MKPASGSTRLPTNYHRDVAIVHFSAVPKPRDKLFHREWSRMDNREFVHDVIFGAHLGLFGKERKEVHRGGNTGTALRKMTELAVIAMKLRDDTLRSGLEWFALYEELLNLFAVAGWRTSRHPHRSFKELVDHAAERYPHPDECHAAEDSFAEIFWIG